MGAIEAIFVQSIYEWKIDGIRTVRADCHGKVHFPMARVQFYGFGRKIFPHFLGWQRIVANIILLTLSDGHWASWTRAYIRACMGDASDSHSDESLIFAQSMKYWNGVMCNEIIEKWPKVHGCGADHGSMQTIFRLYFVLSTISGQLAYVSGYLILYPISQSPAHWLNRTAIQWIFDTQHCYPARYQFDLYMCSIHIALCDGVRMRVSVSLREGEKPLLCKRSSLVRCKALTRLTHQTSAKKKTNRIVLACNAHFFHSPCRSLSLSLGMWMRSRAFTSPFTVNVCTLQCQMRYTIQFSSICKRDLTTTTVQLKHAHTFV